MAGRAVGGAAVLPYHDLLLTHCSPYTNIVRRASTHTHTSPPTRSIVLSLYTCFAHAEPAGPPSPELGASITHVVQDSSTRRLLHAHPILQLPGPRSLHARDGGCSGTARGTVLLRTWRCPAVVHGVRAHPLPRRRPGPVGDLLRAGVPASAVMAERGGKPPGRTSVSIASPAAKAVAARVAAAHAAAVAAGSGGAKPGSGGVGLGMGVSVTGKMTIGGIGPPRSSGNNSAAAAKKVASPGKGAAAAGPVSGEKRPASASGSDTPDAKGRPPARKRIRSDRAAPGSAAAAGGKSAESLRATATGSAGSGSKPKVRRPGVYCSWKFALSS